MGVRVRPLLMLLAVAMSLALMLGIGVAYLNSSAATAAAPAPGPTGRPLAELLNPDGTLNLGTGVSGTLDPSGWQLQADAAGPPRFVPAGPRVPGDELWDDRFPAP